MDWLKILGQVPLAAVGLYLAWVLINKIFAYLEKRESSESRKSDNKFDRLCDKIDRLVDSNHEMCKHMSEIMLSNQNTKESIQSSLDLIFESVLDTQKRVVRIDDRTYKCLENGKKVAN